VWLNHATPDAAGMQLGQLNVKADCLKGQLLSRSLGGEVCQQSAGSCSASSASAIYGWQQR